MRKGLSNMSKELEALNTRRAELAAALQAAKGKLESITREQVEAVRAGTDVGKASRIVADAQAAVSLAAQALSSQDKAIADQVETERQEARQAAADRLAELENEAGIELIAFYNALLAAREVFTGLTSIQGEAAYLATEHKLKYPATISNTEQATSANFDAFIQTVKETIAADPLLAETAGIPRKPTMREDEIRNLTYALADVRKRKAAAAADVKAAQSQSNGVPGSKDEAAALRLLAEIEKQEARYLAKAAALGIAAEELEPDRHSAKARGALLKKAAATVTGAIATAALHAVGL